MDDEDIDIDLSFSLFMAYRFSPLFDSLRNDPEFKEMLRRVLAEKARLRERLRTLEAEGKL